MSALARAIVPEAPPDVRKRPFADLDPKDAARLAGILRPLPWIDGLMTAAIIAPEEPTGWQDHIWAGGQVGKLTPAEAESLSSLVDEQFIHVCDMLFDEPAAYRPFLGDRSDQIEAAAQWAAGFRFGVRLLPEPWRPLIDDDDARTLLVYIFCLERDGELSEDERAASPFHGMPPSARDDMRRNALPALADVIPALNVASIALDTAWMDGVLDGPDQPYVRTAPKIGRNDPCPCGSGRKYKKCCRSRLEQDE